MNYQKNIIKYGKKSAIVSKKNLILNLYIKILRTKTKYFKGKINPNFHNNKAPNEGSQYIFLSVILINSVYRKEENYCP